MERFTNLYLALDRSNRTNDKLAALTEHGPAAIYTANIGCWLHLAETAAVPVRHWIEAVDDVT